MNQKETNPFKVNGTKEVWDKIQENAKINQPVRFPGIGIEQTPMYQMQKQKGDKSQNKKQDYYMVPKGKELQLNIIGMYNEIDDIKQYQSRMERYDPINKNLLQHKLSKAIEQSAFLWGGKEQMKYDPSLISFEKSITDLLNHTNNRVTLPQVKSQGVMINSKYIFTKKHNKIKMSHEF